MASHEPSREQTAIQIRFDSEGPRAATSAACANCQSNAAWKRSRPWLAGNTPSAAVLAPDAGPQGRPALPKHPEQISLIAANYKPSKSSPSLLQTGPKCSPEGCCCFLKRPPSAFYRPQRENKESRSPRSGAVDLPVVTDSIRNIKSMWEKGNVFNSPGGAGSPFKVGGIWRLVGPICAPQTFSTFLKWFSQYREWITLFFGFLMKHHISGELRKNEKLWEMY